MLDRRQYFSWPVAYARALERSRRSKRKTYVVAHWNRLYQAWFYTVRSVPRRRADV